VTLSMFGSEIISLNICKTVFKGICCPLFQLFQT